MRVFRDAKAHTRCASFAAIAGVGRVMHIIKTFGIAPRTVTEAIHAMEADGHVVRRADLSDRRAKVWSLTSAGGLEWIDIDAGVSRTIYGGHLQTG